MWLLNVLNDILFLRHPFRATRLGCMLHNLDVLRGLRCDATILLRTSSVLTLLVSLCSTVRHLGLVGTYLVEFSIGLTSIVVS